MRKIAATLLLLCLPCLASVSRVSDRIGGKPTKYRSSSTAQVRKGADTVLLMHFDGTNGMYWHEDSSVDVKKELPIDALCPITTSRYKFGNASLQLFGQFPMPPLGQLRLHTNSDWLDFDRNDFTIDFWFYNEDDMGFGTNTLLYAVPTSSARVGILLGYSFIPSEEPSGTFYLSAYLTNTNPYIYFENVEIASSRGWHHMAFTRSGGTFTIFMDGTVVGTLNSERPIGPLSYVIIGGNDDTNVMYGEIDEFRIVRGRNMFPYESFTPPSAAYTGNE